MKKNLGDRNLKKNTSDVTTPANKTQTIFFYVNVKELYMNDDYATP